MTLQLQQAVLQTDPSADHAADRDQSSKVVSSHNEVASKEIYELR